MTAHTPDDAYGIVRRLVGPVGPELSCDECFDQLDVYVELEEGGSDADAAMPAMHAHLLGCPACRDDHDSLRALPKLAACLGVDGGGKKVFPTSQSSQKVITL